jgi:hypothetical protein
MQPPSNRGAQRTPLLHSGSLDALVDEPARAALVERKRGEAWHDRVCLADFFRPLTSR